jgi:hypothetical protein
MQALVLVDVFAVLEMLVTVVEMVQAVLLGDRLVPVTLLGAHRARDAPRMPCLTYRAVPRHR